jgi:hypothetical protein
MMVNRIAGLHRNLKWDPYFKRDGNDFTSFWGKYLFGGVRDVLYILGNGFDPRMCLGIEALYKFKAKGKRDCLLIEYDEGPDSPSSRHADLVVKNVTRLQGIKEAQIIKKNVNMWSGDGPEKHRVGSRSAAEIIDIPLLRQYSDIVVDISALPRSVYLSLIGKLLYLLDTPNILEVFGHSINLHIVVCEDTNLDKEIIEMGIDDSANYVHGFSGASLSTDNAGEIPKVWIPVLGENQIEQLNLVYRLVDPTEICPVIPSPSKNPGRGEKLIREYHSLLFDQWQVEPGNVLFASEFNPFDVYRQIVRTIRHYHEALKPLGGCNGAITVVSNKLLSLGGILAAHELQNVDKINVGIPIAEAQGYQLTNPGISGFGELVSLWLVGEPYE